MKKENRIKAHKCMGIVLVICCILGQTKGVHAKELSLYARSALLMDASNGRVLYEENGYRVMPMASTTKIMTCILALEWIEQEQRKEDAVIVSGYAARMPKVRLGMKEGEEYRITDLLYSLMLESHNDTAVAIAEHIDGDVKNFARRMNEKAKILGCKNTNFITPNGLDAEEKGRLHSTTAYDLAIIASYAIQNEAFLEIIQTRQYSFSEITTGKTVQLTNKNRFLDTMDGAIGIKTGFTSMAGYCFVGAVDAGDRKLVSVVLGSGWPPNKNWKWTDTVELMTYGIEEYESKDLEKKIEYDPVAVSDGIVAQVKIRVEEKRDGDLRVLLSEDDKVTINAEYSKELNAPVEKGEVIGYECYYINGELYKKYKIVAAESVELRTYFYCLRQIFMLYF